jgi:hypothetical protein
MLVSMPPQSMQKTTLLDMQVASACGVVYGIRSGILTPVTVQGVSHDSDECTSNQFKTGPGRTTALAACLRCPNILPETKYVVALVGNNGPSGERGGLTEAALVNVTTAEVVSPEFSTPPTIAALG